VATLPDQTSSRYRFVIMGLVAFLGFSSGLSLFTIGPIAPLIIDDYGINNSTASLLTGLVFLVHVAFAIPASLLVGRVGLKKLIAAGALLNAAPLLSFLATDSFLFLLALRGVFGLGFILFFPASGPLFMQWFRSKELPLVNGVFVASVSLGIAASAVSVAPLAEAIGWEAALSAFGALSLVGAVFWLALGKAQTGHTEIESHAVMKRLWAVLRTRSTFLVAAADAGPLALLSVALAWLPTFYYEAHGISLTEGGVLMGIFSIAGVLALVLASLLASRTRRRRPYLIIPGILIGFAGFGAFLLADSIAVYFAVVAMGFACWFYLPALLTIPMELTPHDPGRVSMIFATLMTVGGVVGFLAPLIVGGITDLTGSFLPGLALASAIAWSLGIAGFLLPETGVALSTPKRDGLPGSNSS
jgi:cyanate permease